MMWLSQEDSVPDVRSSQGNRRYDRENSSGELLRGWTDSSVEERPPRWPVIGRPDRTYMLEWGASGTEGS